MNLRAYIIVAVSVCTFTFAAAKPEYEQGVVLIKFKAKAGTASREAARTSVSAEVVKRYDLVGIEKWKLGTSADALEAAEQLAAMPGVQYAQANYIHHIVRTPNDTRYSELWGMNNTGQTGGTPDADIDAPEAWDISTGNNIIVAVVDTGVDYTHQDIAANMWHNPGEIPGNSIDDDGNGYVDDVYGIDAANGDSNPMDDNGHGTHCSGTIAGVGNNGLGVAGVCWSARIMACKFLNSGGSGSTADAIECIQYATRMGARVMNNSWGGGPYEQALFDAIEVANKSNVLFCAAAGNSGSNNDLIPQYPANYTNANILSVAATDDDDLLASFSCYGSNTVDIAAPGVSILSSIPGNTYDWFNGTSMATPHCAGAGALLLAANPGLNVAQLKAALMNNADPKTALAGKCVSGARLNVFRAIQKVAGTIGFDREKYKTQTWALVTLIDAGYTNLTTTNANLRTSAGDSESLTLAATGAGSITFTNLVYIEYGTPVPGNGILEGVNGTTLYAFYYNAVRAMNVTGSALVDIQAPVITGVGSTNVATTSAMIVWQTSEAADSTVRYGTSPGSLSLTAQATSLASSHSVSLGSLAEATVYYYSVESADAAGNLGVDTNIYSFTTRIFLGNFYDFEAGGASGWTHSGTGDEWEWGVPTAGPGVARSLTHCWGTDLDNTYSANANESLLSPSIVVPSGAKFVYSHWYETESSFDYGYVEISTNGGVSWYELVPEIEGFSGEWLDESMDFNSYAGKTVRVRFRFYTDSSVQYDGWYIDDVGIGMPMDVGVHAVSYTLVSESDGDGFVEPGETAVVRIVVMNAQNALASNVNATVAAATNGVVVSLGSSIGFGDIPARTSSSSVDTVELIIAPNWPGYDTCDLNVAATCADGGPWTSTIKIPVTGIPIISFTPLSVARTLSFGQQTIVPIVVRNTGTGKLTLSTKYSTSKANVTTAPKAAGWPAVGAEAMPGDQAATSCGRAPSTARRAAPARAQRGGSLLAGSTCFGLDIYPADPNELVTFTTAAPDATTLIGATSISGGDFVAGGDFMPGDFSKLYGVTYAAKTLVSINAASGASTVIAPCTPGSTRSWCGMAIAPDGTVYASSYGGSSYLHTLDIATGVATEIGQITPASALIIDIAIDADGQMYGLDIGADQLIAIDKATGAGTVIGPTGFNANYAQDMEFDDESGLLYLAAYNGSSGMAELRIADTTTGNTTLVDTIGDGSSEIDCFAIATGGGPWWARISNPSLEGLMPGQQNNLYLVHKTRDSGRAITGTNTTTISLVNNSQNQSTASIPVTVIVVVDQLVIKKAGYKFPWNKNFADSASLVGSLTFTTTNVVPDLATSPLTIRFGSNEFFTAALPAKSKQSSKGGKASYLTTYPDSLEVTKGSLSAKPFTTKDGKQQLSIKFSFSTKNGTIFDQFGFTFNQATGTGDKTYQFEMIIGDYRLYGNATKAVTYKNTEYKGCSGNLKKVKKPK